MTEIEIPTESTPNLNINHRITDKVIRKPTFNVNIHTRAESHPNLFNIAQDP